MYFDTARRFGSEATNVLTTTDSMLVYLLHFCLPIEHIGCMEENFYNGAVNDVFFNSDERKIAG